MNETMTTTRRRQQFTAEDRQRWTEQYERSGLSVRDFCRDHPLCQSSLSRWVRQRRTATHKPSEARSLVEVRVTPVPVMGSAASVTVRLPGGVTMEVPGGTEVTWLAGVLRALRPDEG